MEVKIDEFIEKATEKLFGELSPEEQKERVALVAEFVGPLPEEETSEGSEEERRQIVEETMKKVGSNYNAKEKKEIKEMLEKTIVNGSSLSDAIGFNDDYISWIHMEAYKFFKAGKFPESCNLFLFLEFVRPEEALFSFGVAVNAHNMKQYEKAIAAYFLAAMKNRTDPMPYYHMSDCYLQLGDKKNCCLFLARTLSRGMKNPIYAQICERAKLMMAKIEEEIGPIYKGER